MEFVSKCREILRYHPFGYDWAIAKHKRGTIPCDPFEEAEDVEVYRIDSKEKFYAYYEGRREKIIAYLCARFGIVQ